MFSCAHCTSAHVLSCAYYFCTCVIICPCYLHTCVVIICAKYHSTFTMCTLTSVHFIIHVHTMCTLPLHMMYTLPGHMMCTPLLHMLPCAIVHYSTSVRVIMCALQYLGACCHIHTMLYSSIQYSG